MIVLTVFAGAPDVRAKGWNTGTTKRKNAADALALRRREDDAAMRMLGASAGPSPGVGEGVRRRSRR